MERLLLEGLLRWKNSKRRKPLVLRGLRRVGKTWILKEFGRRYYKNAAYFNFAEKKSCGEFFECAEDADRVLQNLMLAGGQKILPEKTLVIFDEVQEKPEVLRSMKLFQEQVPQYHLVCTGFPLGSEGDLASVQYLDFLQLTPMNFTEFLMAGGDGELAEYLKTIHTFEPVPEKLFDPLLEKLKMYYVTGGMPEPVLWWTQERDMEAMQESLSQILYACERDFARVPDAKEFSKVSAIWSSIPVQLAGENKKFNYQTVKRGARKREYEDALQWLSDTGLATKVYRNASPALPFPAGDDPSAFKLYPADVGMLRRLCLLSPTAFGEGDRLFTEFQGALSECCILEALAGRFRESPRYWSRNNPFYEVDFILQYGNERIPVEVRAERNAKASGLKKYREVFHTQTRLGVCFSLDNLKLETGLLRLPFFLADEADRLIGMALNQGTGNES